ncbi:hypothetical protein MHUMG1_04463 [Metarhizium humberi]|uniref:Uncharacterized protein n=1 Tax=Metarhizium humberi TaxID=2596975 RepID=A0A9P8MB07_9HYPO|nr:hypothetical protein MHUMG1_04463 [Metarhizium humberi]
MLPTFISIEPAVSRLDWQHYNIDTMLGFCPYGGIQLLTPLDTSFVHRISAYGRCGASPRIALNQEAHADRLLPSISRATTRCSPSPAPHTKRAGGQIELERPIMRPNCGFSAQMNREPQASIRLTSRDSIDAVGTHERTSERRNARSILASTGRSVAARNKRQRSLVASRD